MIAVETEGIISVPRGSGNYVISKRSRLGMVGEEDVDVFELFKRVALWSLKHALWQRPGYALSMDRRRSTTISLNLRKHYSRSRRA
jgi:hypothetical protein